MSEWQRCRNRNVQCEGEKSRSHRFQFVPSTSQSGYGAVRCPSRQIKRIVVAALFWPNWSRPSLPFPSSALLGFDVFCEMFSRFPLCSLSRFPPGDVFAHFASVAPNPPFASLLLRPNTFQQLHTTKEHRRGRLPLFHDYEYYDFCSSSFFGLTYFLFFSVSCEKLIATCEACIVLLLVVYPNS